MSVLDWISAVMLVFGALFGLTSAVGVLRFPDFYSRLHPAGIGDTLAQTLILGGLLLQSSDVFMAGKLVLITVLLYVTSPTATHAISQAAQLAGLGASQPARVAVYQAAVSSSRTTESAPRTSDVARPDSRTSS